MNELSNNDERNEDALLTELLRDAVDIDRAPREQHLSDLRRAIEQRLNDSHRPLLAQVPWSRLLASSGAAAALVLGFMLWMSSQSVGFAEVAESVQAKPWIHGKAKGNGKPFEFWFAPSREVSAMRHQTTMIFDDHRLRIRYEYDQSDGKLLRLPHGDRLASQSIAPLFQAILRGDEVREDELTGFEILGRARREIRQQGATWIEYEFALRRRVSTQRRHHRRMTMTFLVDPRNNLPVSATVETLGESRGVDAATVEFAFDYPKEGPTDIFALGVPRTAKLVDSVPSDDVQPYLAGIEASRHRFDDYQALVHDGNLYRVSRKGNKWRWEWGQRKSDTGWFHQPPRYSNAWFQEYAKRVTFVPLEICDGTTIYQARLSDPDPILQQVLVGWEVKGELGSHGIDAASLIGWAGAVMPEFHAYPLFHLNTSPRELSKNQEGGPGDAVLLHTGSSRYWCNPARSYVVVDYTTTIAGDPRVGTLGLTSTTRLEDFAQSPGGTWYAQTVKTTHSGYEENTGEPTQTSPIWRFHLDFDVRLPDSFFEPEGRIFQLGD